MIKKILLMAALVLPMFASAQTLKIGVIDTNEILNLMPETKDAQNKLQESQNKYEAEYTKIQEELQRQYNELQEMKEDELPAIRDRKVKEFQDNGQKLQAFEQQIMNDLQKQHDELMAPIVQKVRNAIESVGKENGFSLIQEKAAQLYFAAPVEDITPKVKSKLGL